MNKKGVTLIELVIYIALLTIISLLIGKQFKRLIANFSGNKQVMRQQTEARGVLGLMIQEIRNTGSKVYLKKSGSTYTRKIAAGTIVSSTDSSSFVHTQGDPYDELTIYKLQLDKDGDSVLTDTTRYYVSGTTLKREYMPSKGFQTNSVVAENVYALQYHYGILASNTAIISNEIPLRTPLSSYWESGGSPTPAWGSTSVSVSCVAGNSGYLKYKTPVTVAANEKYEITLKIRAAAGFPQNLGWAQVSFQNSNKTVEYGREQFKPSATLMKLTVAVHTASAVSGAYFYLDYSAAGTGVLTFSGIEVRNVQRNGYTWTYEPTAATDPLTDKINVRAIRMYLLTRTEERATTAAPGVITVGEVTVTPPGESYAWRLYTETIETPNNGRF
jgi:type II secretory pathway component PulJ